MSFFYNLNKRLADLSAKQDAAQLAESKQADHVAQSPLTQALNEAKADTIYVQHSNGAPQKVKLTPDMKAAGKIYVQHPSGPQTKVKIPADAKKNVKEEDVAEAGYSAKAGRAGKDLGKPGKNFSKIAKGAAERYGSKEAGERVAGAVLNKLRHPKESIGQADEGNAFTGKLKATPKGEKFKLGDKEFKDTSDLEEGFADMDAWLASREKEKGTGRFDKRKVSTGTVYTRKPETFDDPETDPEATGGAPKRRGRPKGKDKGPERVTAKSYKYKSGRPTKTKEDLDADGVMMTRPSNMSSEGVDHGEYDREGDMAKEQMHTIMSAAKELHSILRDEENLPEWVQKKITLAKEYIDTARDYMLTQHAERAEEQPIAEKAVSVAQRRAAGIAHAAQKGEIPKKELRGASKEMAKMPTGELKKFAKTKETGLPKKADEGKGDGNLANNAKPYDKVTQGDVVAGRLGKDEMGGKKKKEDKVDETTVAGSVATAPAAAKKSSGGMQFGKGVYEGFNNQVESMITEGMNISVNMNAGEDGETRKSITVSADGAEADQLAALLKMAGLQGQAEETCSTCGASPCGCEQTVDEAYGDTDETLNDPDWPTNTETLAAEPNLRTYSGGLNGPKSTGQTTVPVVASQERRLHSMEESAELERSLFKTWKNYKG
jgi:hypothetical protein